MPASLDPDILAQLQPHAFLLSQSMQTRSLRHRPWTVAEQRRIDRAREKEVVQSLWTKAHQLGLTTFPVPPFLVSIFLRALWSVVWALAQEVLADLNKKNAN